MFIEHRDHVLIVEDNQIMADVLKRALARCGVEATVARNGVEACELTRERKFAVIVTDFNMPRMNGDEFVRNLRLTSLNSDAPVIFVSGRGLEVDTEQLRQDLAIHAFLFKPFSPVELVNLIKGCLESGSDCSQVAIASDSSCER